MRQSNTAGLCERPKMQVQILVEVNFVKHYLAALKKLLWTVFAHFDPAVKGYRQFFLEWWDKWMGKAT